MKKNKEFVKTQFMIDDEEIYMAICQILTKISTRNVIKECICSLISGVAIGLACIAINNQLFDRGINVGVSIGIVIVLLDMMVIRFFNNQFARKANNEFLEFLETNPELNKYIVDLEEEQNGRQI